jgi:type IV pilus assembly protein PilF
MKKLIMLLIGIAACLSQPQISAAEQLSNAQTRAQVHTELGAAYYSRGQLGVALEELKDAINSDSHYAPAYNMLGLVYMELREFPQAEENFQQAFNLDNTNPDIHNNYGWFLCQRGRTDEAIKHFFAALKNPLYTTPEKSYLNAGVCSLKKNDEQSAEDFFLRALKLRPQEPQALYYLSEMAYKRADFFEARNYLVRLLQAAPPGSEIIWLALRIERKLGNRDAEAEYALQLRKNFPDSREMQALRSGEFEFSGFAKLEGQKVTK